MSLLLMAIEIMHINYTDIEYTNSILFCPPGLEMPFGRPRPDFKYFLFTYSVAVRINSTGIVTV